MSERGAVPASTAREGAAAALLTIVIPCFNERGTVLRVIQRVKQLPLDKAVIVVDNCSTDGTRELLRAACTEAACAEAACAEAACAEAACAEAAGAKPSHALRHALGPEQELLCGDGFVVVLQPRNFSKGASVKLGLSLANSEYFICQDADWEYNPEDIVRLLAHARSTGAVAVFGSRLSAAASQLRDATLRADAYQVGRVLLTRLFRILYRSRITDVATCYKLMRTDVARALDLKSDGFGLDFEIPAKLRLLGHTILELPIEFAPRDKAQGKKIRWRDGATALWILLGLRLLPVAGRLQAMSATDHKSVLK